MSVEWCYTAADGVRLTVQITPAAKKNEVIGLLGSELKIRLQAPPIEGKANAALVRYIAASVGVPKSRVQVVHGHTSRRKVVEISVAGLTPAEVQQALWPESATN